MKKASILLLCCLMMALSACGDKSGEPSELEHESSLSEPVEASPQEPDPVEADMPEPDALLPNTVEGQMERMRNGDFSNVTMDDYARKLFQSAYDSDYHEWVECDNLNGNGLKGLLWQQKDSSPLEIKRIDAIFAVTDSGARLVDSTFGRQGTERFFLSKNGNIIYVYSFYGTDSNDHYTHYIYEKDGSKNPANRLTVIRTWDWAIGEMKEDGLYDEWVKKYPHWAEAGIYYFRRHYAGEGEPEELGEEQFLREFEEMTGYSFYDDNPSKPEWANWVA